MSSLFANYYFASLSGIALFVGVNLYFCEVIIRKICLLQ